MGKKRRPNIWVVPPEEKVWDRKDTETCTIYEVKEGVGFICKVGVTDDWGKKSFATLLIPFRRILNIDENFEPEKYIGKKITITNYWKEPRDFDGKKKLVGYNAIIESQIERDDSQIKK